jgi:hypothetical protein
VESSALLASPNWAPSPPFSSSRFGQALYYWELLKAKKPVLLAVTIIFYLLSSIFYLLALFIVGARSRSAKAIVSVDSEPIRAAGGQNPHRLVLSAYCVTTGGRLVSQPKRNFQSATARY